MVWPSRDHRARLMASVQHAGQRLRSADRERHAALDELTAACAALPNQTADELARTAELPLEAILAIRVRLLEATQDASGI